MEPADVTKVLNVPLESVGEKVLPDLCEDASAI